MFSRPRDARLALLGCALGFAQGACTVNTDLSTHSQEIVGGTEAAEGDVYGTVALGFGELDPQSPDNCTGTLIAPRVVLTAAHCFFSSDDTSELESPANIKVYAGALTLADATESQQYVLDRFAVHPDYDHLSEGDGSLGDEADVALAFLASDVSQVAIVAYGEAETLEEGTVVTVSGYGADSVEGNEAVGGGDLKLADVSVYEVATAEFAAVGDGGEDACPGDSGGPVYALGGAEPIVVGVVSRADPQSETPCGEGGIYTRVSAFEQWIADEMASESIGVAGADGSQDNDDDSEDGGCSFSAGAGGGSGASLLAATLLLALSAHRRRRRRTRG